MFADFQSSDCVSCLFFKCVLRMDFNNFTHFNESLHTENGTHAANFASQMLTKISSYIYTNLTDANQTYRCYLKNARTWFTNCTKIPKWQQSTWTQCLDFVTTDLHINLALFIRQIELDYRVLTNVIIIIVTDGFHSSAQITKAIHKETLKRRFIIEFYLIPLLGVSSTCKLSVRETISDFLVFCIVTYWIILLSWYSQIAKKIHI